MADPDTKAPEAPALPTLEEIQQWTWVMGRAQQMMLEHVAKAMGEAADKATAGPKAPQLPWLNMFPDPAKIAQQQTDLWTQGLAVWQRALGGEAPRTELAE
ncbi:MAG TPA: class I poly(R)-hydroxyalkanoic acid synthase, partial [Allosphingosinicella sp.]